MNAISKKKKLAVGFGERSFLSCLFLRGFSKLRLVNTIFLWLVIANFGWLSSPVFMYYVIGVPKLEEVKTYEGVVRVEGHDHYSRSGKLMPPRYFLDTSKGVVELHCGIKMSPSDCTHLGFSSAVKDMRVSLAYDTYFGVLAVTYSGRFRELLSDRHYEDIKQGLGEEVWYDHKRYFYMFVFLLGLYAYWLYRCCCGNR